MNKNISKMLDFYCQNEMDELKKNAQYISISQMVESLNLKLVCEFGKEMNSTRFSDLYISVSVLNEDNEFIEIWDEGYLSTATILVSMDKKDRFKFYTWKDNEFLDDLDWINNQLKMKKNKKEKV